MKTIVIVALAMLLTACATTKVKRAYEDGYASGHKDAQKDLSVVYRSDMESLSKVNDELRRRLDNCHFGDRNK